MEAPGSAPGAATGYQQQAISVPFPSTVTLISPIMTAGVLFTRIAAAASMALVRWPEGDKKLSTCVPGVVEQVEAYKLKSGAVELMAMDGGGIGTHSKPSAQLGGSFMADLGVVVFDPFAYRVWARKQ